MLKGLKWMLWTLVGLGVLVLGAMGISWLLPVPDDEARALQAMAVQPAAWKRPQDNAFPAVWLLPYDGLSTAQAESAMARDLARHEQARVSGAPLEGSASVAEDPQATLSAATKWCQRSAGSCLQQVRGHRAEVTADHAGHDALHARIGALADYRYYRSTFTMDPNMPFPQFGMLLDRTSAHALTYLDGDSTGAMAGICEDAAGARMMMRGSDTLIMAMIAGAWADRSARLFTEILAELPADAVVPPQCHAAFAAPDVAELDLCEPMRGEFAFQASAMNADQLPLYQRGLFNAHKTRARTAWLLSRSCGTAVHVQLQDDVPVVLPEPKPVWTLQCAGNVVGCILMGIDAPSYDDYHRRTQDNAAQLRLAGAMLWLRSQPRGRGTATEILARLPMALDSPSRPIQVTRDGRSVEMERYDLRENEPFVITAPLPPAWWGPVRRPLCARPA